MESTKLLMIKLKLNRNNADNIVINSMCWRDQFNSVINLRDSFFNINFDEE